METIPVHLLVVAKVILQVVQAQLLYHQMLALLQHCSLWDQYNNIVTQIVNQLL